MIDNAQSFSVPIRTVSEMNASSPGSWRPRFKRAKAHKLAVERCAGAYLERGNITFPVVVRLTRLSAGTLDDDNLRSALKACRDAMATWLRVDDGDTSRVRFQYAQEPCKRGQYAVNVTVISGATLVERVESKGAA